MVNISESNFSSESNLPTLAGKNFQRVIHCTLMNFWCITLARDWSKIVFFKNLSRSVRSNINLFHSNHFTAFILLQLSKWFWVECCNGMNGKWNVKVVLFKFVFESFSILSLHWKIRVHNWCEWKSEKLEECRVTSSKALTLRFKSSLSHLTLLKWNVLYTIRT